MIVTIMMRMILVGVKATLKRNIKKIDTQVSDFELKIRNDLSINCKDVESLGVELLHVKKKNTLFNVLYRPSNGQIETFENFLRHLFHENKNSNKNFHIAGDSNLNLLDHNENQKVQIYFKYNTPEWYATNYK